MIKLKWIIYSFLAIIFFVSAGFTVIQQSNPQDKDPGVGPIKKVEMGPINNKMVAQGKKIFMAKCIVCHDLNTKKIGPPLKNITKESTPEYIMNLLLNAVEMQKQDPHMKDLLKKYNNVLMPASGLSQAQARTVLEYLRSVAN